jgi:adenylate cyclase class IV
MHIVLRGLWRLFFAYRPSAANQSKSAAHSSGHTGDKGTNFEVERKFRLKDDDEVERFRARLAELSFLPARTIAMTDRFLPVKVPGEMLRVRDETIEAATHTVLTIKEWVEISGGKERRESEGHLTSFTRALMLELGTFVNRGKALLQFSKVRQEHENAERQHVIVTIDEVYGLGENSGHYAEIEVLVTQDGNIEAARSQIADLARELFNEDREPVKASYMDMLKLVS